ncbi:hypothetical protein OVA06_19550 [Pseudarthrobacter sp. SL88]|uniref:hypothetical protein n=1 Tax=Pseudarthrobacter sp. SL88 TaxID=2994666 RepID=UPI0022725A18|nr:hypothetical protein [Pseudarthrobacter sp. SL88]MCY1676869.1 hypothetical protein [Pseudarthrobacter sp. SL88]
MPAELDAPLTTWYCDDCGGPIIRHTPGTPVEQTGVISWRQTDNQYSEDPSELTLRKPPTEYKVRHNVSCDNPNDTDASYQLDTLLGVEGLQLWSELLWNGPAQRPFQVGANANLYPALDLLHRFQVPYYEQARQYFKTQSAQEIIGGRAVLKEDSWKNIIREGSQEIEEGL